jgi:UDP-3-O-[3-hydroxymyristoyl] N-acetylglucosamine deacetylase
MALRPAPIDTGIVFCRSDLPGNPAIPAPRAQRAQHHDGHGDREGRRARLHRRAPDVRDVRARHRQRFRRRVAEEVPIMDGSAGTFVFLLQSAGIEEQAAAEALRAHPERRSRSRRATSACAWSPSRASKVGFTIEFDHPVFRSRAIDGRSRFRRGLVRARALSRARTFGFTQDVEMLRSRRPGTRRLPRTTRW